MRKAKRASGSSRATTTSRPGPTSSGARATGAHQHALGPERPRCLQFELAHQGGAAPGQRAVLGDADQRHVALRRPGQQLRQPAGRDPPVRLQVAVDQDHRSRGRFLRRTGPPAATRTSPATGSGRPGRSGRHRCAQLGQASAWPSGPAAAARPGRGPSSSPCSSRVQRPSCQRARAARVATTCRQRASATSAWPPSTAQQSPGAASRARGRAAR